MSDLDLCFMPAHEALARSQAKTLSPVGLVEAVIARAAAAPGGWFTDPASRPKV